MSTKVSSKETSGSAMQLTYRRSKSSSRLLDDEKDRQHHFNTSPDQPVHSMVESPFSTASGFNNFRGLLNLGVILLVLSNIRVALENIMKYGILVDPFQWFNIFIRDPFDLNSFFLVLAAHIFILAALGIELLLSKNLLSEFIAMICKIVNSISLLLWGCGVILYRHPNPLFSAPVLGTYCVVFMKLWSYHSVNRWCRTSERPPNQDWKDHSDTSHDNEDRHKLAFRLHLMDEGMWSPLAYKTDTKNIRGRTLYPDNLNVKNIYYFICAPTLCYELNYPRNLKIRKRFLIKRILEFIFLPQVILCLAQQWIMPLLHNSSHLLLKQSSWPTMIERLLKLAIPNHLLWLLFFYWYFHATLNLLGELLLFADRCFYKDWWNSGTVTQFWSSWNIPVHRWARRHIFLPLVARGWSKLAASVAVFTFSAFFHELLVSVPLRMFRLWAFSAMLGQVPLAIFVNKFYGSGQFGNYIVWISIIIGQPLALMMYFHDYYVQNMMS